MSSSQWVKKAFAVSRVGKCFVENRGFAVFFWEYTFFWAKGLFIINVWEDVSKKIGIFND